MQLKEANNGDQLQPNMTDRRQKLQRSASFVSDQTSMEFMSEVRLQDLYYLSSVKYTPFHSFFDVSNGIYNSSGYKEKPKNQLTCGHDADTTLDIEKELGHIHSKEQIYIKGINGKTLMTQVQQEDTVDSIKKVIEVREGIPSGMQHIIYAGKQLFNGRTISHYNIHAGSTLHLALCLHGGAETITGLIDLYMSTRCEHPHINEFIELNKFVLYKIGWDPVNIRKEWTKGLSKYGYKDRPDWQSLKREYEIFSKHKKTH